MSDREFGCFGIGAGLAFLMGDIFGSNFVLVALDFALIFIGLAMFKGCGSKSSNDR